MVRVYVQAWFTAPQAVAAPRNDLMLLKKLHAYKSVHKQVSAAACASLLYHSWYLNEIWLGMAVFDESLSDEEKADIVRAMHNKDSDEEPSRKRDHIQLNTVDSLTLADLATKNSMNFFTVLDVNKDFLEYPVAEWASRDDYIESRKIVSHLKVVNDIAERGVKLFKDFNKALTKNETSFQNVLVSVQSHRKSRPDFQKKNLVSKFQKDTL